MCTALSFKTKDHYFGRTLDLDSSYGEEIVIVPRNYEYNFKSVGVYSSHYALIGMAKVVDNIPLFYDATNEWGLSVAGLNFPNNAYYNEYKENKDNISPFELILWILFKCKNVKEAILLLDNINIVNIPFNEHFPLAPLHFIVSDKDQSIVIESMKEGLFIQDNPLGIMTNNPPFKYHLDNLEKYKHLNKSNGDIEVLDSHYCQGLGALGLPGDVSSMSRFVRLAFNKTNSKCNDDEVSSVSQFFHLLDSVSMINGVCQVPNGHYDITVYTSCVNTTKGIYYYTTYNNHQITCVDMHNVDLDSKNLYSYKLIQENLFIRQN